MMEGTTKALGKKFGPKKRKSLGSRWQGLVFPVVLCIFSFGCIATAKGQKRMKIAVFAPVYLDSAFNGLDYRLSGGPLPKQMVPGLEFYQGAMAAADSFNNAFKDIEILFYDLKGESLYSIIRKLEFQDVDMIIASFNARQDVKPLSDIALHRNIPLISATYPNDGGVNDNPLFVQINPSLKTHFEAITKYILKTAGNSKILYVRKKGALEDLLDYYFTSGIKKPLPNGKTLAYKKLECADSLDEKLLSANLDSFRNNIVICGSLNESFGIGLVTTLAQHSNCKTTAIGMPTWDGLKDLDDDECNGVNIVFTTVYNYPRGNALGAQLLNWYKTTLNAGKPSEMFFKGFESVFHFGSLLLQYRDKIGGHLSENSYKLFNEYDLQPNFNKTDKRTQYLENQKIHIIKKLDGVYQ